MKISSIILDWTILHGCKCANINLFSAQVLKTINCTDNEPFSHFKTLTLDFITNYKNIENINKQNALNILIAHELELYISKEEPLLQQ